MITRSPAWADLAGEAFAAGLAAGHPHDVTMAAMATLDTPPSHVIAIGKAGAAMAGAVRDAGCNAPGIVVTHDEGFAEIDGMRCFASAHPVPDARGMDAAAALAEMAAALAAEDHLLLLISGGGSALVPAPADGVTLADKQALNAAEVALQNLRVTPAPRQVPCERNHKALCSPVKGLMRPAMCICIFIT